MNRGIKIAVLVILGLVILAIIAAFFFKPHKVETPPQVNIDTTNQPTIGDPNAKIQIVVFEDLKCFNCMRYETTIFPQIKELYINTGKAKYTLVNLAFIFGSMPAANAARCLYEQNPAFFFPFVDYIYAHQPPEAEDWATIPTLMDFASQIPGVDKEKLSKCLVESPHMDFINNNLKLALKAMNNEVQTPTLFIDGMVVHPLTLERVKELMAVAEKRKKG